MNSWWFLGVVCWFATTVDAKELRWDWRTIASQNVSFPKSFIWGVATSAHQVEGDCLNNWSRFEERKKIERSGRACEHGERCFDDIALLQELGVKAYRFSVEWSKIEPQPGVLDYDVLYRYRDFCDALKSAGIMPVVTLYAGTHPIWFDDRGAFEREQNIDDFIRFGELVVQTLHDRVGMWCTISDPGMYAFQGYLRGTWPPGKVDAQLGGTVLKHLLQAHCALYKKLKSLPGSAHVPIGIAHTMVQFDPYRDWNPLDSTASEVFSDIVTNCVVNFFKTGTFRFVVQGLVASHMKWQASVTYADVHAPRCLDFFGVNYYSHIIINSFNVKEEYRSDDIKTDMPYALYPEGMYRAIVKAATLGVPLYITENGVADARDDRRDLWLKRYIYALYKARCDGYDVRGYFYRPLMDCFEWERGYTMKFGLYHVDFATQRRTLRKGAHYFLKMASA